MRILMTCYTRPNEGRSDLLYSNYYEGRGRGEGGSRGNRVAMPRKGEHFSALREESARQVPPNASEDEVVLVAPARTPRTAPGHRGLSLQRTTTTTTGGQNQCATTIPPGHA